MKKSLFLLVIGFISLSCVFLGCDAFMPPDIAEIAYTHNDYYAERKDVLALKHLQVNNIDENTLASFVMSFLSINSSQETGRSVLPSPIAITNSKEIIHEVETGFAETTADKRPERAVIGPGQIPFYVFTLENQQTGQTGFALTCADNRIGNVLAVVEQGNYDDDIPFLHVFYSQLHDYIEDAIGIYNSVTEADVENALSKKSQARNAPVLPVSEVGRDELKPVNGYSKKTLGTVLWGQGEPYNKIVMNEKKPDPKYRYVTGCGPVAIAIILAYHGNNKWADTSFIPVSLIPNSSAPGYTHVKYYWN